MFLKVSYLFVKVCAIHVIIKLSIKTPQSFEAVERLKFYVSVGTFVQLRTEVELFNNLKKQQLHGTIWHFCDFPSVFILRKSR